MSELTDRIKQAYDEINQIRSVSYADIGAQCGVTAQAVKKWMHGEAEPRRALLDRLARALNKDFNWLSTGVASPHTDDNLSYDITWGRIVPIYEWNSLTAYISQKKLPRIGTARSAFPCSEKAFQAFVDDASNEPDMASGDAVIIDPEIIPKPGDYVMVLVNKQLLLRRYQVRSDHVSLMPRNPDFPTVSIPKLDETNFIGVLAEHTRRRRG